MRFPAASRAGRLSWLARIALAAVAALAGAAIASVSAAAEPLYLSGTIGSFPVQATLERDGNELRGWYFYLSRTRQIRLGGHIGADGAFRIEESEYPSNQTSAIFEGTAAAGRWSGTWRRAAGGAALPLRLQENHDTLAGLSAQYECKLGERTAQAGYTYRWSLKLAIDKGVVKALSSTQGSYGPKGDDQACQIDLDDLAPVASNAGILLQAKDQENGEGHQCTVRIVADAASVRVAFGEPGDADNDCRRSGTTMYCSPRADWSDLVIDRASRRCLPVK